MWEGCTGNTGQALISVFLFVSVNAIIAGLAAYPGSGSFFRRFVPLMTNGKIEKSADRKYQGAIGRCIRHIDDTLPVPYGSEVYRASQVLTSGLSATNLCCNCRVLYGTWPAWNLASTPGIRQGRGHRHSAPERILKSGMFTHDVVVSTRIEQLQCLV